MPLIAIHSNAAVPEDRIRPLLAECSKKLATLTGKPESYVMTLFTRAVGMTMAGTEEPCCLAEIRGVGQMTGQQTRALSKALCPLLSEALSVEGRRVYLNFISFEGSMWGWDSGTFG